MNDLKIIYESLKTEYNIRLTLTGELNDGYTIDTPVIRGECKRGTFDLYEDEGLLVFSYEDLNREEGYSHLHPYDSKEAIKLIKEFMSKEN